MPPDREPHLVVLDVGKTNLRLAALDEAGRVVSLRSRPNRVEPGPPYPHLDVEGCFEWLVAGLAEIAGSGAVRAIVPVAHGAAAGLIASDSLALPVLDYEFEGPASLGPRYPRPPFAETLSPPLAAGLNLGRQLFWQREHFPDAWARVERALPYAQYWAWRLSGVAASEITSLGCHTDLWIPRRNVWSPLAAELGEALFPPLARAWDALGPLRPELRAKTGIDASCQVLAGVHDSNASFFAHRVARTAPFAVLSTGTWVVAMAHGGSLAGLCEERDTLANVDAFGNALATARFMGGREYAERAREVGAEAAARECAARAADCLGWIDARGELIIEGPFARNEAFCRRLAELRPAQRLVRSHDDTGTLAGALALWRHGLSAARRSLRS